MLLIVLSFSRMQLPVDFWHFCFSVEQFHQPPTPLSGVNHHMCVAMISLTSWILPLSLVKKKR